MYKYAPLLFVGGIVGLFSLIFIVAYATMKDKKAAVGFDRHMKDGEIVRRLLHYAKPHIGSFVLVGLVMTVSIAYDITSPLIISNIERLITSEGGFEMGDGIMQMMGGFTVLRLTSMLGMINVSFTKEELLKMNKQLNRIRKPKEKK
jgi:ATP-binding cassette subfamily B protein